MQAMTDERQAGVALGTPHANGAARVGVVVEEEREPRSRATRIALLAALVVVIGLWGFALVYSVVRKDPERLTTAEHSTIVQSCKTAVARMLELPAVRAPGGVPPTKAAVAARTAGETAVLTRMIAELRQVHPQRAATAEALGKWLDDWDSIIVARHAYALQVLTSRTAELVIPADRGVAISVRMNNYAKSKFLVDDCGTTTLGAENVNAVHR
ncbi:MAG: hypothetical protein JWL83_814 [Actinomycetia bacterium]|nr:hypothetical protein [Actinomycetes bacterium]